MVLAALLLPALSRSRARAQAVTCMNNTKNLTVAWNLYSGENDYRLAYNLGGDPGRHSFAPTDSHNWVNNVLDWELTPDNTNADFVNKSLLAPFASFSTDIFRCPADRALSEVQRSAGWSRRARSISMNAMVGDPGPLLKYGANVNNPEYEQFLKESDIQDPSSIFVFLDEHPDSINDGYFLNTGDGTWVDLPASYHYGSGSFSFADGHTEIHRWRSESTIRPARPDAAQLPIRLHDDERADYDWVMKHMSTSRRESVVDKY
jgi:prepilin-type processing-associated H-X9-DG protein